MKIFKMVLFLCMAVNFAALQATLEEVQACLNNANTKAACAQPNASQISPMSPCQIALWTCVSKCKSLHDHFFYITGTPQISPITLQMISNCINASFPICGPLNC